MLGDDEPAAEDLKKIFNLISPFYQWIVIDLGRLNGVSMRLLERIDEVFVVTTTALPALHEAKRVIDALVSGDMDRERVRLIVNQTENVLTLSGSEFKRIFGIGVYATLPNDSQELYQACLQRKLPAASSNIGRQIVDLAHKLAGIKEKKGKRNLPEFLSFVERFHKGGGDTPGVRAD
jgi:Flp pilus assembly CpaE family ATPase